MDGSPAGAFHHYVFVNDDFMALPYKQQRAIMAHELVHVKYKDVPDRFTIITRISITMYIAYFIFILARSRINLPESEGLSFANFIKENFFEVSEVSLFFYLQKTACGQFIQFQEQRADIDAAKVDGVAAGLQDWLKNQLAMHGDYHFLWQPLAEHPTYSVRIAYLQKILDEKSTHHL